MRTRVSASLALVVLSIAAFAQPKHSPSFDEQLSIKRVAGPRISPDGRFIAYAQTETNWKDNEYMTRLWLADTRSGRTFQLTRGRKNSVRAQWSPDGRWLAFMTEREAEPTSERDAASESKISDSKSAEAKSSDKDAKPADKKEDKKEDADAKPDSKSDGKPAAQQLWLISPEGGEAWQLTKSEGEIDDYAWSPDSTRIAFIATVAKSKPQKDRKDKFADFEVFEREYDQHQLFVADIRSALEKNSPAKAAQLTRDPEVNVNDFAWSPDSKRIAFSARRVPLLAFTDDSDIYLLDLGGSAPRKIIALAGPDEHPVFSPDGKQLAFVARFSGTNYYYLNAHIAVVDVDKALAHPVDDVAQVNDVAAKFDENPNLIDWGSDGIYFSALQRTSSHVFRIDPRTHVVTRLSTRDGGVVVGGTSFTRDFKTMAFTLADERTINEVYVSPVATFAPRRLTAMNDHLKDFILGSAEVVSWKSADGATIEGILHKPADYDAAKKYPLLVVIHGGPTGISLPVLQPVNTTYPTEAFLARGALVLEPNYRGSAGYGQTFRAL